ncbi:MAG: thiamine pyrophosphate-binding protein [Candidatus Bathyarchaeia archaeon]
MAKSVRMTGGAAVAKALKECGVDHMFYVTGGMGAAFYKELEQTVNMVLCRNEKTACNMADGYSRVTRRPSVCYSQHGAAAAILASMLYEPMYAHSPVVALTGSVPIARKNQWYYQDCDEMHYFDSTCKFNVDVTDLGRLAEYVRTAVQVAVSGCPGPTHVNMHTDMSDLTGEMPEVFGDKRFFRVPPFRPRAESERVMEAAKMLAKAEGPVIICGSGVHISEAYDEMRELAELLTIPVVANYKGRGCLPEEHPLYVGVMGTYGVEYANDVVRESDVVFFLGTRAEPHMTEELTAPEPGASKIIHLDIDPMAIGRNYQTDIPLVGDAKLTLQELITILKYMVAKPMPKEERLKEVAKIVREYEESNRTIMNSDAVPIKPQRIMKEVSEVLGPRDVVVSDTGFMLCWATRFLKLNGSGLTFVPCGGTLGSSFGLALGVSFGVAKDQRVLNMIGDGGLAYNLADLETAKRYTDQHAPFVVLVNNNSGLAQSRPKLEDWTRKEAPWIKQTDFTNTNYARIAEEFGCYGIRVERAGELADALRKAFDAGRPAVVDVVSDKREYAPLGLVRRAK